MYFSSISLEEEPLSCLFQILLSLQFPINANFVARMHEINKPILNSTLEAERGIIE